MAPMFLGAFAAVMVSVAIILLWRTLHWPGGLVASPAGFFFVMGLTFTYTKPRWRVLSLPQKLGIAALYGLFGAVAVGGINALLLP